jgi:two-component system response regulator PilR (NtrC family)
MQSKLLQAIQERGSPPVDSTETQWMCRSSVPRIRDLNAGVQAGQFRQDLYYRLNVIEIAVPALKSGAAGPVQGAAAGICDESGARTRC